MNSQKIDEVHYENRGCFDKITALPNGMWLSYLSKGQLVWRVALPLQALVSIKSFSCVFPDVFMLWRTLHRNHGLRSNCLPWGSPSVWSTLLTNKGFHMLRGNWQTLWIHNRSYTEVSINYSSRKMLQWSSILLLKCWLTRRNEILLDVTSLYKL